MSQKCASFRKNNVTKAVIFYICPYSAQPIDNYSMILPPCFYSLDDKVFFFKAWPPLKTFPNRPHLFCPYMRTWHINKCRCRSASRRGHNISRLKKESLKMKSGIVFKMAIWSEDKIANRTVVYFCTLPVRGTLAFRFRVIGLGVLVRQQKFMRHNLYHSKSFE